MAEEEDGKKKMRKEERKKRMVEEEDRRKMKRERGYEKKRIGERAWKKKIRERRNRYAMFICDFSFFRTPPQLLLSKVFATRSRSSANALWYVVVLLKLVSSCVSYLLCAPYVLASSISRDELNCNVSFYCSEGNASASFSQSDSFTSHPRSFSSDNITIPVMSSSPNRSLPGIVNNQPILFLSNGSSLSLEL